MERELLVKVLIAAAVLALVVLVARRVCRRSKKEGLDEAGIPASLITSRQ